MGGDQLHNWQAKKAAISIHTTRVGGDFTLFFKTDAWCYFNPHHPCGWWLFHHITAFVTNKFQSTPPVWVVTLIMILLKSILTISIHTTRVGGDTKGVRTAEYKIKFQSTPPVWVVTSRIDDNGFWICISIHTTRVGGDASHWHIHQTTSRFQSTPPVWVVTAPYKQPQKVGGISIHTTRVGGDSKI